ncbi:MAG: retroviral-like aspartic protease family protein [Desulfomonilaceae bacterium]
MSLSRNSPVYVMMLISYTLIIFSPTYVFPLDQTEQFFQDAKNLLKSGQYQSAFESLSNALGSLALSNEFTNAAVIARAQAYYEKGDLRSAWKDLRLALGYKGLSGETLACGLNLRALLYLKEAKVSNALKDFTLAINTPHDNISLKSLTLANRGITFLNIGLYAKAISDFDRAIELDPKSSFNYAARAVANLRTDRVEKARRDSEVAMTMGPNRQSLRLANSVLNEINVKKIDNDSILTKINEDGQIFVQVKFGKNGKPHRFLLDTGATHSLIDKSLLKELSRETRVKEIGKGLVHLADGSSLPVTRYSVENAFLYQIGLGSIQVQTMDKKTKRSFNLLGAGSLKNLSILIDTSRKMVQIKQKKTSLIEQPYKLYYPVVDKP